MGNAVAVAEQERELAGLRTRCLEGAPDEPGAVPAPILYLHGNPVGSWIWRPFLERTGGIAPDLPGFGRSAKPPDFDYSVRGYADYLEGFVDDSGLDRFSLVVHDIGAIVGLVFAQRVPERIDRLVIANHAPLLPGYRWHRFARIWRTPVVGELFMATMTGFAFRRSLRPSNVNGLPDDFVDRAWAELDGGTNARSCASTGRCRRPRWCGKARAWIGSAAPRSSFGQPRTPTSERSSVPPMPMRSGAR